MSFVGIAFTEQRCEVPGLAVAAINRSTLAAEAVDNEDCPVALPVIAVSVGDARWCDRVRVDA